MRAYACVSTVRASCLRKVHPILFLQERSPYSCKIKQRIDLGLLLLYKHKNKAGKTVAPIKQSIKKPHTILQR